MDYLSALLYLAESRTTGVKLALDSVRQLVDQLGSPDRDLRFIHIAGTNGKGSTAAFCAAALQEASHRVGLYTSPHLISVRERIQVDGFPISPEDFARQMTRIAAAQESNRTSSTFFEILTALALLHFQQEKVDWVVWETGLGGRLDATNIVCPAVTIITSISLDHQDYLGTTIENISEEKAGIIKPKTPVVTAVTDPSALVVIARRAGQKQSPLIEIGRDISIEVLSASAEKMLVQISGHLLTLGLTGPHQGYNAACAFAALQYLGIALHHIRDGFAAASWPGRFHLLRTEPPLVLDGAHNAEATEALLKTWLTIYGNKSYHLVYGALRDKAIEPVTRLLRSAAHRVSLVTAPSERAHKAQELIPFFTGLPTRAYDNLEALWPDLEANPEPTLITGSLYLVGQTLRHAQPQTQLPEEEMMNEKFKP
jgi:dihydrofolate synthase / folylpolyglutamate synthase